MTGWRGGGGKEGWRPKGRRYTGGEREGSVVGAAPGLFLLGSSGWRGGRWRCRLGLRGGSRGLHVGETLRAGLRVVESGGVLKDAAGVFGDGLDAGGIGGTWILDAAVIGADSLVDIAAEMIEQAAEQQAGIGGEHGIIDGIEVQLARRPQARRQLGVVTFVFQVKLMRGAESFARDLPGAHGVVTDHDAFAAEAKNDVVALRALLPDGVLKIAVDVHVIVLHGADAEEVVERKRIKLCDIKDVGGELGGLLPR